MFLKNFFRVVVLYLVLLLYLSSEVEGLNQLKDNKEQQEVEEEGKNHNEKIVTKFLYWAQVVSSFTESLLEREGSNELIDKLRNLAHPSVHSEKITSKTSKRKTINVEMKSDNYNLQSETPKLIKIDKEVNKESNVLNKNQIKSSGIQALPLQQQSTYAPQCTGGVVAIPATTIFTCGLNNVTAQEYRNMSVKDRRECTYNVNTPTVCVCPTSTLWTIRGISGEFRCIHRLLIVSPRIINSPICRDQLGESLGLQRRSLSDYCLRVRRNATINLSINVTYRWMENDEMVKTVSVEGAPIVIGNVQHDLVYITLRTGEIGTYRQLERSRNLFSFIINPNRSNPYAFGMVGSNPLYLNGYFEHIIYPFSHPERMYVERVTRLLQGAANVRAFFGGKGNYTLHTIRKNLRSVSDEFISGNIMYMEIGFAGGGIPFQGRYARIWISFEDYFVETKNYTYGSSLNSAIIAGIIIGALILIGAIVAIAWCFCNRPQDIDDRLVIEAQQKGKEKKDQ